MTDNQSSIKCKICDIKFSKQEFRSCNRRSYYRPSRIKFPGGQQTSEGFDKPDPVKILIWLFSRNYRGVSEKHVNQNYTAKRRIPSVASWFLPLVSCQFDSQQVSILPLTFNISSCRIDLSLWKCEWMNVIDRFLAKLLLSSKNNLLEKLLATSLGKPAPPLKIFAYKLILLFDCWLRHSSRPFGSIFSQI